jgi:rhamnulokinase
VRAANATGRTVLAGPIEATALGNVLSQALALGQLPNLESTRAVIGQSFAITRYEPQEATPWQAARERFATLSPTRTVEVFHAPS